VEVDGRAKAVFGMPAHVHVHLAALGLRADAQVLDRAADDADRVPLKVGENDQHVRQRDGFGDVGLLEDVALREVHQDVIGPAKAIGDDEGATQGRRGVAVSLGGDEEVQRRGAGGERGIRQRGGIADEWPTAKRLDAVGQRPRIDWPEIGRVVPLSAVQLDGYRVAWPDHLGKARGFKDGHHLLHQT